MTPLRGSSPGGCLAARSQEAKQSITAAAAGPWADLQGNVAASACAEEESADGVV